MATRRENAEMLRQRLGVSINTENSKPLAATLQGWVDRSETDPDTVKREALTFLLEDALDVELTDQTISTERLAELLTQAEQDPQAVRDALRTEGPTRQQDEQPAQPAEAQQLPPTTPDPAVTPDPPVTPDAPTHEPDTGDQAQAGEGTTGETGDDETGDEDAQAQAPAEPATLTVRLSDAVPKVAGTYSDREQPPGQRAIGRTPVTVLDTPGIRAGLRVGTLVLHEE